MKASEYHFSGQQLAFELQTLAQECMISQLEEELVKKLSSKKFDEIGYQKANDVILQLKRA